MTIQQMHDEIMKNIKEVNEMIIGKDKIFVNRIAKHMPELMKYLDRRTFPKKDEMKRMLKMAVIFKGRVKRIYDQI